MRLPRNNGPEVAHLRRTGQSHRSLGSGLTLDTAYYGGPDPQRLPIPALNDLSVERYRQARLCTLVQTCRGGMSPRQVFAVHCRLCTPSSFHRQHLTKLCTRATTYSTPKIRLRSGRSSWCDVPVTRSISTNTWGRHMLALRSQRTQTQTSRS